MADLWATPPPIKNPGRALLTMLASAAVAAISLGALPYAEGPALIGQLSPFQEQISTALRNPQVETIAFGDSHAGLGFFSDTPTAVSLAWPEVLIDIEPRIDWALVHFPGLKTIALEYQPHMFYPHRDKAHRSSISRKLEEGDPVWHPFASDVYQFYPCCRAMVPEWTIRKLLGVERQPDPRVSPNGYLEYSYKRERSFDELARLEIQSYGGTRRVESLVTRYGNLVRRLAAAGYDVVLTRYPLHRAYRAQMGSAMREAEIGAQELRRAIPRIRGCGRWDWSDADAPFLNADHLTPAGAKAYWNELRPCVLAHDSEASARRK